MDQLFQETRQDIKDMKEALVSIDKNLSLTIERLNSISQKTADLEKRVSPIEDHARAVKIVSKIVAVCGAVILFFAEIIPAIKSLFVR